jgi:hypothetical protein
VLKWLGWAALGRLSPAQPRFLLFPAELFAGLALGCAWFYVRNALAALWPASYGLGELAVLAPVLAAAHLFAAVLRGARQGWRLPAREVLARLAVYAPFWGALTVMLWRVSASLNPQTLDPIFHACAARSSVETGLFRPHPFLNTLYYPSGFGAVNAVAMSLAPLSAAQAVNLQHVLWQVTALYLLAAAVLILAGRRPWAVGLLAIGFLLIVPLYSLYPDDCYSGTPRQMSVALLAAVGVLPLLVSPRGAALIAGGTVVAFLGVLAAAMNPACVPFAGFALLVALVVFALRARALRPLALQVGLAVAVAALVLACDPYYLPRLRMGQAPAAGEAAESRALPAGPALGRVLLLAPNGTGTGAAAEYLTWPERRPYAALPALALTVMAAAVGLAVARRWRDRAVPPGVTPLTRFILGCAAVWVVGKPVGLALGRIVPATTPEAQMLRAYLGFLLLRCELLLLFAAACAAGCVLALFADGLRPGARLVVRFGWWLGLLLLALQVASDRWPRCGNFVMTTGGTFVTTPDDLALVAWCDEHVPPERGLIGLAAATGRAGVADEEKHLSGVRGMPGFLLYGKRGNYCFTLRSLEGDRWYDDYCRHVRDAFDSGWCVANGIRYFYATPQGLRLNPGLAAAVESGRLRLLHAEGESRLYEVTGG